MKGILNALLVYGIACAIVFFGVSMALLWDPFVPSMKKISIEDYHQLLQDRKNFILYIGRASCKNCSITTLVTGETSNGSLPIYHLELEPYYQTPQYDSIKKELNIIYVPSFKYVEKGMIKYHMNPPLDNNYFSTGSDRNAMRLKAKEQIQAFIDGASGIGPVIDEDVLTEEIPAVPITAGGELKN